MEAGAQHPQQNEGMKDDMCIMTTAPSNFRIVNFF
jgi:hypothetical protein